MKSVMFTAPAFLCAAIAFPALLVSAAKEHNWPQALLCAFLPGCFLVMGGLLIRMSRDISRMRRRIAKLEAKGACAASPGSSEIVRIARED